MRALVTGASGGIGRDIARYLSKKGIEIYAVGRNEERLLKLKEEIDCNILVSDLALREEAFELYEKLKDKEIDILVNNAGFGLFGDFESSDLSCELEMIDTNITALHILTKLFYKDFMKRNSGYILNVSSSAGFMAGPLLSTYYATKNYVLQLTKAIYEETRRKGKNVHISVFCPGPVDTGFGERANVRFSLKGISSKYAARYAVDKMFKNKLIIIPTMKMKCAIFLLRLVPHKIALKIAYKIQKSKE